MARQTPDTEGIKAPLQNAARPIDTYYTPAEKPVQKPDNTNPMLELAKSLAGASSTFDRAYTMMQQNKKSEDKTMQQHLGEGVGRLYGARPLDPNDPTYKSLSPYGQFHAQVGRASTMTDEFLNNLDSNPDVRFIANQTDPAAMASALGTMRSVLYKQMDEAGIPKDAQAYATQSIMQKLQQTYESKVALAGANAQEQGAATLQSAIVSSTGTLLKPVNPATATVQFSASKAAEWRQSVNGSIVSAIMAGVPYDKVRAKTIEAITSFAATLSVSELEQFTSPGMLDGIMIGTVPLASDPDIMKRLIEQKDHAINAANARTVFEQNQSSKLYKDKLDSLTIQANTLLNANPNADIGGIISQMSAIPGAASEVISLQKYAQQVRAGQLSNKHTDDNETYTKLANMVNDASTPEDRRKLGDAATEAFSSGLISKDSWTYFTSQASRSTTEKTAYDSALVKEALRANAQTVRANSESFMHPSGDAGAVAKYNKIMADYRVNNPNATTEDILKHSEMAVKALGGGSGPKFKQNYNQPKPTTSRPAASTPKPKPQPEAPLDKKGQDEVQAMRNEEAARRVYEQVRNRKKTVKDLTPLEIQQLRWVIKQNSKHKGNK